MALIVLPEGTQISGSIGGTTYSHNRYGAYKRNRSIPVNPNTDRQVTVRNFMTLLSIAWQNVLTQDQRDAWNVYALNVTWKNKLNQTVHLTGLAHYVRSNVPRLLCNLARIDDAPVIFNLATTEQDLGCTASEATQLLILTFDDTADWCSEDGAFQIFYMGLPQNGGIAFFGGPWRKLLCLAGDSMSPQVSPAAGQAPPNWPFAEGQRLWIQSRVGRADGRLSEFAQVNFLAAA